MKTIKLLTILLLLLSMLVSMVACGDTPDPTPTPDDGETDQPEVLFPGYETLTIAQALELCGEESGYISTERYYVVGKIDAITNGTYGGMTISDETGSISVYGTYSFDGELTFAQLTEKPTKGDTVLLHCILQNYEGTKEIKNARLIDFIKAPVVDDGSYTEMTIAAAREAATGTKVKVDGVVARITYANGMKPSGFYLVDETQSIYVYDSTAASSVSVGNKVTIHASKTYWILDTEQSSAAKHGYEGCCQLENATLVANDNKTDNEFDKSWIPVSTVKDILETPVTEENITTTIYKVTALVSKSVNPGYINYYINDLDYLDAENTGTGSYVYTQCNGGDFAWLDAYDGKICTIYLSALNAKSTNTGCVYRFIPVAVEDNGYTFDLSTTPAHVVKYHGLTQFLTSYTGDPSAELLTTMSSTILGYENATLSYSSSNTSVVSFEEVDGKVIFHCGDNGQATITVTATYGDVTASDTLLITVLPNIQVDSLTVAEAVDTANNTEVYVKGIVGPSLVNKTGFYLIDETGIIAVQVKSADIMKTISIGNEVIVKGTKETYIKSGQVCYGQVNLYNSEIAANYYGNHEYSTASFVTDKTVTDLVALSGAENWGTTGFTVTATIYIEGSNYSTKFYVKSGDSQLLLYSGSASQYSFLNDYNGQEVVVEVALCNWNKDYYRGCVLAIITPDGKIYNELNFN